MRITRVIGLLLLVMVLVCSCARQELYSSGDDGYIMENPKPRSELERFVTGTAIVAVVRVGESGGKGPYDGLYYSCTILRRLKTHDSLPEGTDEMDLLYLGGTPVEEGGDYIICIYRNSRYGCFVMDYILPWSEAAEEQVVRILHE